MLPVALTPVLSTLNTTAPLFTVIPALNVIKPVTVSPVFNTYPESKIVGAVPDMSSHVVGNVEGLFSIADH